MNPSELAVQVYLLSRTPELGKFTWNVIKAKEINKIRCAQQRIGWESFKMTPQEELFMKFYNHEAPIVAAMNDLELRAHREELYEIIAEAKARMTRADDELKERKKKGKVVGFETSLQTDQVSSDAINAIKQRSKRMSMEDKLRMQMIELQVSSGLDRKEAEKLADQMMSARTIMTRLKDSEDRKKFVPVDKENLVSPKSNNAVPFVNPFEPPAADIPESKIEVVVKPKEDWNPFA